MHVTISLTTILPGGEPVLAGAQGPPLALTLLVSLLQVIAKESSSFAVPAQFLAVVSWLEHCRSSVSVTVKCDKVHRPRLNGQSFLS